MTIMRWDDWIVLVILAIFLMGASFYVGYECGKDASFLELATDRNILYRMID